MKKFLSLVVTLAVLLTTVSACRTQETGPRILFWKDQYYVNMDVESENPGNLRLEGVVLNQVDYRPLEHGEAQNIAVGTGIYRDPDSDYYLYLGSDREIYMKSEIAAPTVLVDGVRYSELTTAWLQEIYAREWPVASEIPGELHVIEQGKRQSVYLRSDILGLKEEKLTEPSTALAAETSGRLFPLALAVPPWIFIDGSRLVLKGSSATLPEGFTFYETITKQVENSADAVEGSSNNYAPETKIFASENSPGMYFVEAKDGHYTLFVVEEMNGEYFFADGRLYLSIHTFADSERMENEALSYGSSDLPAGFQEIGKVEALLDSSRFIPPPEAGGRFLSNYLMSGTKLYRADEGEIILATRDGAYGGGYEIFLPADALGLGPLQ